MRDQLESLTLEERVVEFGEAVQKHHAENRAEGGEQNGQLVRRREGVVRTEHRLAADEDRIVVRVHPPDHDHAGGVADHAAGETEPADLRVLQAHGLVHPVDRIRAEHVPAPETGVTNFFRRVHQVRGRRVFREHAKFQAHQWCPPFAPPSG